MASERLEATVRIYEPILPVDRGERYLGPLGELLEATGLGAIAGAGTQLTATREIEYVEIELTLEDDDAAIDGVLRLLSGRGAPRYSRLYLRHGELDEEITFGIAEGVAVTLRGVPPEAEVGALLDASMAALVGEAEYRGAHVFAGNLALYFYGLDAELIWERLRPVLVAHALGRGARAQIRCGHPDGQPHEVILPG